MEEQQKNSLSLAKQSSLTHNENRIKIGKLEEKPYSKSVTSQFPEAKKQQQKISSVLIY